MTAFSFTSFLQSNGGNNNNGGSRGGNGGGRLNKPSERQIKFYYDLCERKKVTRKDITQFSFEQLGKEIDELQKRPDPASDRQITKIRELEQEIISLGGDLKPIGDDVINSLTGGREGTASSFIQALFDMRSNMNIIAPPTDAQLKILVEWYLCPDIPFESFSSEEVFPMKNGANVAESQTITVEINRGIDLGNGQWRHMTPNEFAEEIKSKMTKRQASKFIDDYRGSFYDWKKTRITEQQIKYIRELEMRLANISAPKAVEYAIVDGEVQEIRNTTVDYNAEWNPMAYEPADELALAQLSFEEASQWIDQLKSEVDRANRYQSMYNEEELFGSAQQDFEERNLVKGENRRIRDEHDSLTDEYNKLNDLIFAVEAILGYEDMQAHEYAKESLLNQDVSSEMNKEYRDYLKNFFMNTVTVDKEKDNKRWTSQMARIFNMCEDVPVALEILAS